MNKEVLTVSQFNTVIKEVLENLGIFKIKGEITEMRITPNKGLHLTLSDGKANVRIGGYAPSVKGIDLVEEGMEVVVEGTADIYVPYGSFSLKIFSIEPAGEGALQIAYQKLKEKLEKEGLFADEHKQPLPSFITKIALLTGKDSAAYSDFIKILREHNVAIDVDYYPVLVQGDRSVKNILGALEKTKSSDAEVIVLTRGGGSLEDLKSFNDEELARIIFSSPKAIIVGVGHEKDESIGEFVADIRSSTPSQAAYYIVKQNEQFIDTVVAKGDTLAEKLLKMLEEKQGAIELSISNIEHSLNQSLELYKQNLIALERILKSYDIRSILRRGFALISKASKPIKSIKQIKKGDNIQARMSDGKFNAEVTNIS